MDTDTYSNARVIALSNKSFVNAKLNADEEKDLFHNEFNGGGLPATYIVEGDGTLLITVSGYKDADAYLRILGRAKNGYTKLVKARKMLRANSEDAAGLFLQAEAYGELGRKKDATAGYEEVIKVAEQEKELKGDLKKYFVISHARVARALAVARETGHAKEHLTAARNADPKDEFGQAGFTAVTAAVMLLNGKAWKQCIETLTEALEKYPKSGERDFMHLLLGISRHRQGDNKEAIATFQVILKKYPDSKWTSDARSWIKYIRRQLDK